MLKSEM